MPNPTPPNPTPMTCEPPCTVATIKGWVHNSVSYSRQDQRDSDGQASRAAANLVSHHGRRNNATGLSSPAAWHNQRSNHHGRNRQPLLPVVRLRLLCARRRRCRALRRHLRRPRPQIQQRSMVDVHAHPRLLEEEKELTVTKTRCGRPVSMKFHHESGDLYITEACTGLLKVVGKGGGGEATVVATEADGVPINFTDDNNGVVVDQDTGDVFFTDYNNDSSSTTGRLIKYDPRGKPCHRTSWPPQ